jgi:hypothetical protein
MEQGKKYLFQRYVCQLFWELSDMNFGRYYQKFKKCNQLFSTMLFKTSLCGLPFITTEIPRYFFSTSIGRQQVILQVN